MSFEIVRNMMIWYLDIFCIYPGQDYVIGNTSCEQFNTVYAPTVYQTSQTPIDASYFKRIADWVLIHSIHSHLRDLADWVLIHSIHSHLRDLNKQQRESSTTSDSRAPSRLVCNCRSDGSCCSTIPRWIDGSLWIIDKVYIYIYI